MRIIHRAAVILSLVLAAAPGARAQEPASRDERELGGHRFIPSGRFPDPFVTTHARFRTAGGVASGFQASYTVPGADTVTTASGDIAFFGLDFEYQQNLFERASLRLSLEGNARVGTDNQSLLASGLSSAYGMELEAKFRILRYSQMVFTGHAVLTDKSLYGLDPLGFAQGIAEDGFDDNDKLVVEGDLNRLVFGPSAAWAPKAWLGFTGHIFAGPADPFDSSTDTETAFRGGLTGEVDFKPLGWWPIGVVGGYDSDSFPEADNDVVEGVHSFTFAATYTGRDDFSIGLEVTQSQIKQKDLSDEFGSTIFSLNSRYYF
jgi:hypothetical protein